jgi:hypothetical protein
MDNFKVIYDVGEGRGSYTIPLDMHRHIPWQRTPQSIFRDIQHNGGVTLEDGTFVTISAILAIKESI